MWQRETTEAFSLSTPFAFYFPPTPAPSSNVSLSLSGAEKSRNTALHPLTIDKEKTEAVNFILLATSEKLINFQLPVVHIITHFKKAKIFKTMEIFFA